MNTSVLWVLIIFQNLANAPNTAVVAKFKDEAQCQSAAQKVEDASAGSFGNARVTAKCVPLRGAV